jgi:hypothetical protein
MRRPLRGFDEFYGFIGRGAHDCFKLDNPDSQILTVKPRR